MCKRIGVLTKHPYVTSWEKEQMPSCTAINCGKCNDIY